MAHTRRIHHTAPLPHAAAESPRSSRSPLPGGAPARLPRPAAATRAARAVMRRFLRCERGGVAIETAVSLLILVGWFSGLMHIVGDVFADDRAGRGARAVARALALDPLADPWAALKREGELAANAQCPPWPADADTDTCGDWTLTIDHGVAPAALPDPLDAGVSAAAGELVLVRLERGDSIAVGLARREPQG